MPTNMEQPKRHILAIEEEMLDMRHFHNNQQCRYGGLALVRSLFPDHLYPVETFVVGKKN